MPHYGTYEEGNTVPFDQLFDYIKEIYPFVDFPAVKSGIF
jgi:hypothetical protein